MLQQRTFVRIFALLVVALCVSSAGAQSFQETSLAFRKFDAKLQVGLNYASYMAALPDIVFAADEYARNAADVESIEAARQFGKAVAKYKSAASAWRGYLDASRALNDKYDISIFFRESVMPLYCPPRAHGFDDPPWKNCVDANWKDAAQIVSWIQEPTAAVLAAPARRKPTKSSDASHPNK